VSVIDLPPGLAKYYIIGVDYGISNPTVYSLIGYNPSTWPNIWLESEYYYDSKAKGRQKTDTELVEDLKEFIGNRVVRCVYVDPSAASFKVECMRQDIGGVIDANNDVLNGIRFVSNVLSNGTLKVLRCCQNAVREFQTYRWDEKVSQRGEDKPIKEFDHCMDALRYGIFTHFPGALGGASAEDDMERIYQDVVGVQSNLPEFFRDTHQENHAMMPAFGAF